MSIWFSEVNMEELQEANRINMQAYLDIRFEEIGPDYLIASLPVDHRTKQPYGLLHGGASVVLAESVGSVAANLAVDNSKFYCLGLDINANHIRSARDGRVYAKAMPLHIGRSTQVWEIKVTDENKKLVAISRLTMAVIAR